MRLAIVLASALLAQTPSLDVAQTAASSAATSHLRYERTLTLPALPAAGTHTVCTVLDAAAFAHTASRSADDLRLYRENASGNASAPVETPFTLLESEAAPDAAAAAAVENLSVKGDAVVFDLAMPHQNYTAIELHLAAADFIAEAVVSSGAAPLGTFTLFDLTQQHLTRSTELALQETDLPRLHVELHLWHLDGSPFGHPKAGIVVGAEVPPSRQAQTLYTTVATSGDVHVDHGFEVVTVSLPAHVPVERMRFLLDPGGTENFFRNVHIAALPQSSRPTHADSAEDVYGTIARINWKAPSGLTPPVHYESLTVDATLGANLRQPAVVRVTIPQPAATVLLRAVELQMRRRSLCFQAATGTRYTLRYGDAGLSAPVYDDVASDPGRTVQQAAFVQEPSIAELGPEQQNPAFQPRPQQAGFTEARPTMFWIGLLSMVTLSAALAAHRARLEHGRS